MPKETRPRPLAAKQKQAVLDSLGNGATVGEAAKAANVSRQQVYKWRARDRRFAQRLEATREAAIGVVEDALYAKAAGGNVTAEIFYLCNRAPHAWKNLHTVKGEFNGSFTHEVKTDLAGLLNAARNNGHGIADAVEKRRAFIGGGAGSSN